MDDLRREAYEEKIEGGMGSMSKMVREAIDMYLEKRKAGNKTRTGERPNGRCIERPYVATGLFNP